MSTINKKKQDVEDFSRPPESMGWLVSHALAVVGSAALHLLILLLLMQISVYVGRQDNYKTITVGIHDRESKSELDHGHDILDSKIPVPEVTIDSTAFQWEDLTADNAEHDDPAFDDQPRLAAQYGAYGSRSEGGRTEAVERGGGSSGSERAVELALEWLQRHQHRDGSWKADTYHEGCFPGAECPSERSGILKTVDPGLTGLSLLAYLGAGYTDQGGRFRSTTRAALEYLIRIQDGEGAYGPRVHNFIYNHLICTLAMSEAYGMTGNQRYKESAERALRFTLRAQHTDGGWGYMRNEAQFSSDVSVTGWAAMVLKSAELAGLQVPNSAWRSLLRYVDAASDDKGLAGYIRPGQLLTPFNPSTIPVGLLCRQFAPPQIVRDTSTDEQVASILAANLPNSLNEGFFYYAYYGSLSLYQHGGPKWDKWNAYVLEKLVKSQKQLGCEAGSWDPGNLRWASWTGRVYSTAMAALTLEVYYRYLPIHMTRQEESPALAVRRDYNSSVGEYRDFIKISEADDVEPEALNAARVSVTESLLRFRRNASALEAKDAPDDLQHRFAATAIRLATVHLRSKNYAASLEEVKDFARKYPDFEDQETPRRIYTNALALLGRQLQDSGQDTHARQIQQALIEQDYRKIVQNPDQSLNMYLRVANNFYEREEWWRTAGMLEEMLLRFGDDPALDEHRTALQMRLAQSYAKSGQNAQAMKLYEQLSESHPTLLVLEALGNEYVSARRYDDALKIYMRIRSGAGEGSAEWWRSMYNIANCLLLLDRTEECERLIRMQLEIRPEMGGSELRQQFLNLLEACRKIR